MANGRSQRFSRAILSGDLGGIGLGTLLTVLEMERRSGELQLQSGRRLGRIDVRDGRVLRARVEGQGRSAGAAAVYQMLSWRDGQFDLWQAEIEGRDEIRTSTTFLLMEGARRADEARGATSAPSQAGI